MLKSWFLRLICQFKGHNQVFIQSLGYNLTRHGCDRCGKQWKAGDYQGQGREYIAWDADTASFYASCGVKIKDWQPRGLWAK